MEAREFNDLLNNAKYDKSAITRIYEEYLPAVKLHLERRFGNAIDADDIAQEVFMKLMVTDLSNYEPVRSPSAWLFKIGEHLALDVIKKNHNEYPLENYENSFCYFDVDDILIAQDVKKALSFLDKTTAQIIYLNKYEGYSFKDIATMLSKSQVAVRVCASRGYRKLKKICNKYHLDFV